MNEMTICNMSEMTVREIVIDWLKAHGCDGLCHCDSECGCRLDDFTPCFEPGFDCVAGVKGSGPSEYEGEYDNWGEGYIWMVPKQFRDKPKGEAE